MATEKVVKVLGVELHNAGAGVHELKVGKLHVLLVDPRGGAWTCLGKLTYDGRELFSTTPRHLAVATKAVEKKLIELRDLLAVFRP